MELITLLWIIIAVLNIFLIACVGLFVYMWWQYKKAFDQDFAVMIEKPNRYCLVKLAKGIKNKFTWEGGTYFLTHGSGLMTRKGKILRIFSRGKPNPLKISFDENEWLDSESVRPAINNAIIQKLIKTEDSIKDMMFYVVVICCIVSSVASVAVALKIFGVIGG